MIWLRSWKGLFPFINRVLMINLDTETIGGYEVSARMKRIWAMELDMVRRFVEVCEEHHLRYWMMGGTLLGAVRHKGFIPWDNDIDLAMPRADYNRLLEIGPTEFMAPMFFQTPVTDGARFFNTYVKIRNGNGIAATREEVESGMNGGIFIDIFCLDEIPDSPKERKKYFQRLARLTKMRRFVMEIPPKGGMVNRVKYLVQKAIYRFIYHSPDAAELYRVYQREAARYAGTGCRQLAHRDFGYHEKFIWDKSDWDDTVQLPFMDLKLNAPAGYDAVLKRQYGDYWQIPEDKSTHDYFEFDPDIPYSQYFQ